MFVKPREGIGVDKNSAIMRAPSIIEFTEDLSAYLEKWKDKLPSHYIQFDLGDSYGTKERAQEIWEPSIGAGAARDWTSI